MPLRDILIITFYACLTLALILLKTFKVGNRRRGVVKMAASLTFVAVGILGCVKIGVGLNIMLAIGLFFAMLGDLFLVFMDKRSLFIAGVLAFTVAGALFCVYSILQFGWQWWSLFIFVALSATSVLCQIFKVYDFGSCKVYLNVYTVFIFACGALGFSLLCQGVANLPMFLFGLGCFLYCVSDVFLGLYMFRFRNRTIDAINSALYFSGMMLVAFSLLV